MCNKKTATYCLSVSLFVHFSFSPIEISVTHFSAPIVLLKGDDIFSQTEALIIPLVWSI